VKSDWASIHHSASAVPFRGSAVKAPNQKRNPPTYSFSFISALREETSEDREKYSNSGDGDQKMFWAVIEHPDTSRKAELLPITRS
jgi:hypothetical protein